MIGRIATALLLALALPAAVQAQTTARAPATTAEAGLAAPAPIAALVKGVDIPFERFTLPNGLDVVVHTDRKAPVVHVGVWYAVGSVDEPAGRSGFAHLFEHLMFYGSAHHPDDHFKPLEAIGATDFNGTTSFDRTNYFQTVPTPALDLALFLESDRMGWLLPALTQEKLDAQRKVVLNEKRQGDNQPGGLVYYHLLSALFPPHHPMSLSTIGTEADLAAATLDDARDWFRDHYGPNNAVLVLAGDIDAGTARPMVERWFGQIPAGPVPGRFAAPLPQRRETTRAVMHDKVAAPRISRFWAVPGRGTADAVNLEIAIAILASGPTSRLDDALVRRERLAVGVGGSLSAQKLAGIASLSAEAAPGIDPAKVEARIDQILARFLADGPTADEVERVAMRAVSGTIRGLEKVGGFGGKGVALAEGQLYAGDPADWKRELALFAEATPESVRDAARRWLARGDHRLTLLPGERQPRDFTPPPAIRTLAVPPRPASPGQTVGEAADRTRGLPEAGPATRFSLPAITRARLSNGLEVVHARRDSVPVVRMALSFPVGVAGDSREKPGTQRMMLALIDEGTDGRLGRLDGPAIARLSERLGASIGNGTTLDRTRITLNALSANLPQSVRLFADIARHPLFPEDQMERVRTQALAALKREATDPNGLAMRALPARLYGPAHPYGASFSGSGTQAGLAAITRGDIAAFHRQLDPAEASLIVVGDVGLDTLMPLLEENFGDWQAEDPARGTAAPAPAPAAAGRILLIDRPDSPQSLIVAAAPASLTGRDDIVAANLANDIFGGLASSRLNQELRERRNWSYGAWSSLLPTREAMPFLMTAPVETAATGSSIAAMRDLLAAFQGDAPPTPGEIARARANLVRSLPGDFETGGALLSSLERNINLGRADDYLETLPERLMALPDAAVASAPLPRLGDLTWIVVGDRRLVEPQLKELGLPVEHQAPE
ncbi:M16 family metallopeptidase [Sandaracinobacteroides sp. A072]|uniref:M16 family metallopeptidase n=1 Tax=Sandaracinobacteroides sp. A072 TaxID=3461146 RepID=UPI0040436007